MKLAIALLLALASFALPAGPAAASEADVYWNCKVSQPIGWCPATVSNPLPTTGAVFSAGRVTADGQIKATSGAVHTVTISPTGAVTAGVLTIFDSASETGTILFSVALPITTFTPFSVQLDTVATTGIFVGFDATLANVAVTVSFK